ncbi:MAG: ATP-binding protein [Myxococcota bacterium]
MSHSKPRAHSGSSNSGSRSDSRSGSQGAPINDPLRASSLSEDSSASANVPPRLGVIRVVVVTPRAHDLHSNPEAMPPPIPPPMAVETTAALARLGDPVELLRAETAGELAAQIEDPSIDMVLLDRVALDGAEAMLEILRAGGPPSVFVVAGDSDQDALDAFRAGASDCVHFGPEYERVLPIVLLEQVRRWRIERQQQVSERTIERLEELNSAIVADMPAGLAVVDSGGLIVATNLEFDRLFPARSMGASPSAEDLAAELLGEAPVSPSVPEFIEARLPHELALALGRSRSATTPGSQPPVDLVRTEDPLGQERAFELRHRELAAQGVELLLISDVTESEWLSARLDTLQRDHQDIVENINSALLVVDLGGRITFANPAAELILGGQGGDLGGREIGDWFGHPSEAVSPIEDCIERGIRSRGAETLLQRGDGHWIPIGVSCSPRLDAEGNSQGVVAVFQDLSEIKELEQQVRQTEKMASIGQLAAGVAHEVNNPMGFIHANLHQMSEYLGDLEKYFEATHRLQQAVAEGDLEVIRAASDDVREVGKEIELEYVRSDFEKALQESGEGAERIRHIVKDLRDFSRPDLPARTPADINQAIDSTVNIVYTMMKHTVQLEKDYAELPKIDAYPMQLKQVFMNLLVNAQQAIEAREQEPGEPASRGVIRVETELEDDEIVVRISDTGVGIPEADRVRIFDPFFTTKPVGAGTGLGLSTCFSIMERHGGRISVQSEVGTGTTFELRLPIHLQKRSVQNGHAQNTEDA